MLMNVIPQQQPMTMMMIDSDHLAAAVSAGLAQITISSCPLPAIIRRNTAYSNGTASNNLSSMLMNVIPQQQQMMIILFDHSVFASDLICML